MKLKNLGLLLIFVTAPAWARLRGDDKNELAVPFVHTVKCGWFHDLDTGDDVALRTTFIIYTLGDTFREGPVAVYYQDVELRSDSVDGILGELVDTTALGTKDGITTYTGVIGGDRPITVRNQSPDLNAPLELIVDASHAVATCNIPLDPSVQH